MLTIEAVEAPTALKQFGLGKQQLVLLVHSGSRELGESILDRYTKEQLGQGSEAGSFAAREYLREHDFALRWAKANRELIARRFADAIGAECQCLWDGCHNSIIPSPGLTATLSHPMERGWGRGCEFTDGQRLPPRASSSSFQAPGVR